MSKRLEVRIDTPVNVAGEVGNQDRIWITGLPHEVGYCVRKPGAPFRAVFYHLDRSELDAIRYALDVRDRQLWPEAGRSWPDRKMSNMPTPAAFKDAQAKVERRAMAQIRAEAPSIWVPDEF